MQPSRTTPAGSSHALVRIAALLVLAALPLSANQNSDVSLVIQFANGLNRFQVGQVIPVQLIFRAFTPNRYSFNTASYDRSGRLGMEQFEVTPPGRDPLYTYYHGFLQGFAMGGLYSVMPLGEESQALQRNLNEWVALDKPGHYTLRVTSFRVGFPANQSNHLNGLVSNVLAFDVIAPDASWQRQTLTRAVTTLDNPAASKKDRIAAEETLRYLDSPGSVRELARQLTKPGAHDAWNFTAGLLGSHHPDLVLKELEARLDAPDAALTQDYLWLLGRMQFARTHAPLPPYPKDDAAKQKSWQNKQEQLYAELSQADDALYQRAADSLPGKESAAKASTVATILTRPSGPHQTTRLPAAEIASAFPLLDEQQQETILDVFSSRLTSPSLTGPLEAVLDKPRLSASMLRINALQTLLAVNPQRGRERTLAEIREPHPDSLINVGFLARCLQRLPDETLPAENDFLADRLERKDSSTRDLDAQLIGRYATGAVLPRIKSIYRNGAGSWDCAAVDGLMRYFLRWDSDYGLNLFKVHGSSCTPESLQEVARLKRWPEAEPAFIQRLNNTDPWQAGDAAEVLGQWGGVQAKQALLLRLRAFSQTWKPRESEFRQRFNTPPTVRDAISLQSALIQSLAGARGWTLSKQEETEVKSLTVAAGQ